ncbi:MAG: crotonase/enoyl-CoA hydratase family protein [Ilumatobacteraceae bacterium]
MSDRVLISITDGVADVVFNRADKRNALDNAMFSAIAEAGEQLKSESGLRAVVLSGDGASFCAGLDFSSFQAMAGGGAGDGDGSSASENTRDDGNPGAMKDGRITHLGQQVCWVWQELPVPVIAAVHGHALGGGFQIALGADIRIVHPDTKMSVREVYWGLVPDMTGTFILSQLVRPDIAKELTFTARVFDAREGAELGVVTRLSDNPKDDAMALAHQIAGMSPGAVRGSKALFNRQLSEGAAEQFAAERAAIGAQIGTPNQIEAVMSGMEKRPPNYTDV